MPDAFGSRGGRGGAGAGGPRVAVSTRARGGLRAANRPASVEIGALQISLPGPDAAFGRRVAERVGAALAERCPRGLAGDIGALSLTVHAGALTEEGLGDSIVEALVGALGRF